ncbi:2-polyprenyl-6-methoxyphenol hydroxylase [Mameliella alba]|uniref:flavin-dependent oxidoreductase n=1 Tax=Mameliella alba TaxID=561184 RepID=UPI00088F55B0|nr:flavin-dependent oxidoreductase [Mameliella alba]OWV47616.1 flavin-dependent oxidoreductase [Mameliella alba]PTR38492.1 2-polyprenyl-6-methoxyphenol hydroxylase-like FAD-dependent oxidoreductase [Mameliella alba]GGF59805.1 flavin-dependent oxidoreductase [Mameliella alba]SDC86511.1 2-polyprenyl-6-methoxyphenol hydroxylase [Mameliella alba]
MTRVIIAGGGIGGLVTALTLHQIGLSCTVYEAVRELKPLGVGINLQPNAVRELFDLGIGEELLDRCGVPAREWALVGLSGADIHAEPRGLEAGYNWPQYAVHRGRFHMALYDLVLDRLGPDAVQTGCRAAGYTQTEDSATLHLECAEGARTDTADLLIGAEGIHSAIRAQMHPDQPPIHWGGALMWRGTTRAKPIRTGSSFVGLGTHRHRMVIYPISAPDENGLAEINWIAERTLGEDEDWTETGWFREVPIDSFVHHFEQFRYDWLDVPAMIRGASRAFENPMIDRDPVPTWVQGRVALMGDAAHAMYPTGSNGASQAVIDARTLGASLLEHGTGPAALKAYDARLCEPVSKLILRNRGAGPFGLLNLVDERCGGHFDDIDAVIPPAEREAFLADYKAAAGFAIETLNAAPPLIGREARVSATSA